MEYKEGMVACDLRAALHLSHFVRHMTYNKTYLSSLEGIDLQRYKKLKTPVQLKQALSERRDTPFVFIYCKN